MLTVTTSPPTHSYLGPGIMILGFGVVYVRDCMLWIHRRPLCATHLSGAEHEKVDHDVGGVIHQFVVRVRT